MTIPKPNLDDVPDEVPELPKVFCAVCGEPATSIARDVAQKIKGDTYGLVTEWVGVGPIKAGCDEHPVKSNTYA